MPTRRCPNCEARWSSRGSRWCGACGAPLVAEAGESTPSRAWGRWLGALGAGALGLLVAALVLSISRADDPTDRMVLDGAPGVVDAEVELPDGTGAGTAGRATCRPDGCALWHATLPPGGEVRASSDTVVHVDVDSVTALDASTGQVAWRAGAPGSERVGAAMPSIVHLVDGRVLLGYSAGVDDDASRLLVYDSTDGQLLLDAELEILRRVFALGWRDDAALVFGTAATSLLLEGSPRSLLFAVTGDGGIPWTRDGVSVPDLDLDQEPLLVRAEGSLLRLDPRDGRALWEHPAAGDAAGRDGEWLVIGPDRDRITRIEPFTGIVLGVVATAGVEGAVAVGPWIGALVGGDLLVLGDDHDQALHVREDVAPLVRSVEVDDRVIVAWGDERDPVVEVVVHRSDDGAVIGSVDVEVAAGPSPMSLAPAVGDPVALTQEEGLVELVVDHGATVVLIDPARGAIARQLQLVPEQDVRDAARVVWRDGVTEVAGADPPTLRLYGPDGVIAVDGTDTLVSIDPLLVDGPAGVLMLDADLVGVPSS